MEIRKEIDHAIHFIQKQWFSVDNIGDSRIRQHRLEEIILDLIETVDNVGYALQDWYNISGDNRILKDSVLDILQNITTTIYRERCDCGCM